MNVGGAERRRDVNQLSVSCCMNCMLYIFAGDLHWFCCFGTTSDAAGASGCLWLLLEVPPGTGNKDVFFLSPCHLLPLFPMSSIQQEANWQESLENAVYRFLAPCNIEKR